MQDKIITDLSALRDADLDQQAGLIARAMNGNIYFPTLADKIAALVGAAGNYHDALQAYRLSGSREDHHRKDGARGQLLEAGKDLGFSINLVAKGNRAMLESTGYPLAQLRNVHRKAKEAVRLEEGVGAITLTLNSNEEGRNHIVQYTAYPVTAASEWVTEYMTDDVLVVSGLVAEHRYAFRLAPIVHQQAPVFSETLVSWFVK